MNMFLFKLRVINILSITCFLTFYSAGINAEATLSERLEELSDDKDLTKLATMLNDLNSHGEMKEALSWLRSKFVTIDGGSRFTYLYATSLEKAGVHDTAVFTYLVARLVARMDAARCKANKLAKTKIAHWEEGLQELEKKYQNMDISDAVYLSEMAISWENKNKFRKPDPWLCGKNIINSQIRNPAKHKQDNMEVRIVSKPFTHGKMVVVDDTKFKPEYLTDSEWVLLRKEVLSEFNEKVRR